MLDGLEFEKDKNSPFNLAKRVSDENCQKKKVKTPNNGEDVEKLNGSYCVDEDAQLHNYF